MEGATDTENTDRYQQRASDFSKEFNLGQFLYILKKNLIWMLLIIGAFLFGAFLYLRYTSLIYQSTSVIQISNENQASKLLKIESFGESDDISAEIEFIRSKVFIKRALSKLKLEIGYFSQGTVLVTEQYNGTAYEVTVDEYEPQIENVPIFISFGTNQKIYLRYTINEVNYDGSGYENQTIILPLIKAKITIKTPEGIIYEKEPFKDESFYFRIQNIEQITNFYLRKIEVGVQNVAAKTVLISLKDNHPQKAADIVNSIAEDYIKYDVERKSESSKSVITFIDQQLDLVYTKLKDSEISLQSFKTENKLSFNTQEKIPSLSNYDKLNSLENTLVEMELEENILKEIQKTIETSSKELDVYNLLPLLSGTHYEGSISKFISNLNALLLKREETLFDLTNSSKNIKAIDYQIDVQKVLLIAGINKLSETLSKRKQVILSKLKESEKAFIENPIDEVELTRLQRHYSINEKFYSMLTEKKAEYSILIASFVPQNKILEQAFCAPYQISPIKKSIFASFFLVGLLMSVGLVVVKYVLHNSINSIGEIAKHALPGISVLGMVPKYKKDIPISQLIINQNPKSMIAEAFRTIRSNLQFISNEPGSKVIAVTSTISGEGKTFVAINLAGIIAFSGKKVIILDLDMRKPKIHLGFNVQNIKGMSTILIEKDTIENTIQKSSQPNLDFITAGPIPPNPSELIISKNMDIVLENLKQLYDVVIIDNPPVGLVTDGISIIQKADYPIYIFRAEYSQVSFVQNVNKLFVDNKIARLSFVLNGVDLQKGAYGYGGGYDYGYGYGYGGYGYNGYGYSGYGYGYGYGYYEESEKDEKEPLYIRILKLIGFAKLASKIFKNGEN